MRKGIEIMNFCYLPVCLFPCPVVSLHGTSLLEDLFDTFDGCGASQRSCAKINHASRTSI